ncbi:hypothetical protein EV383_4849 [Pseudonocardia sediminis]|uniref:Uncharacterized protein n=1 Tax=Pseudonocardia sediminis TaxID=1397368 RepID=A0A4Q7V0D9_PSEST|nr:hypothetical protein [Pseudonocardia sediminis]RZT87917.1 hypothetical protein EV383_4849 [Pseudonocardia sediminis]
MTTPPIERRASADDSVVTIAGLIPAQRESAENPLPDRLVVEPPVIDRQALRLCRCGHEEDAHDHYRGGDDCGVCGPVRCRSFRLRTGRRARSSFRR